MVYAPKDWSNGDTVDDVELDRMEAGIQQALLDVRTRAYWDSSTTPANVGSSTFATVQLPTVDYNVGGGSWSANLWTVPVTGLYFCTGKVRIKDATSARNVGIGIRTANGDGPHFVWQNLGGVFPKNDAIYIENINSVSNIDIHDVWLNGGGYTFYTAPGTTNCTATRMRVDGSDFGYAPILIEGGRPGGWVLTDCTGPSGATL